MDLSGRTLNQKYTLIKRIATSNMASVYQAKQTDRVGQVAVKVLHEHLTSNSIFKKRFELEAKVLLQLQHPHIVTLLDFDKAKIENSEFVFLVMEFIHGGTLAARIQQKGTLSLEETLGLMEQLLAALIYTHHESIAHRDIKPENILFKENSQVVLTDFGLARLVDTEGLTTATAISIGTPRYMAPEILMAKSNYNHTLVDIYSLGVVFYEMVTGQTPYQGADTAVISQKLTNQPYPAPHALNPRVPLAADKVIMRALAYEAKDRYQTMQQFATAVQQLRLLLSQQREVVHSPAQNWLRFVVASVVVGSIALSTAFVAAYRITTDVSSDDTLISPTNRAETSTDEPKMPPTRVNIIQADETTVLPTASSQTIPTATSTLVIVAPSATTAISSQATPTATTAITATLAPNATTINAVNDKNGDSTQDYPPPTPIAKPDIQPASASTPQPTRDNPPPTRENPPRDGDNNPPRPNNRPNDGSNDSTRPNPKPAPR